MTTLRDAVEAARKRFDDKYIPEPNSGCWLWVGAMNSGGYGSFSMNGKSIKPHRFAYERYVGPIPAGLDLDHLCRVRCCVNPAHLEPVARQENALRGARLGTYGKANRAKTHCARGHPFVPENLKRVRGRNGRMCRVCDLENKRRYYRQAMLDQLVKELRDV